MILFFTFEVFFQDSFLYVENANNNNFIQLIHHSLICYSSMLMRFSFFMFAFLKKKISLLFRANYDVTRVGNYFHHIYAKAQQQQKKKIIISWSREIPLHFPETSTIFLVKYSYSWYSHVWDFVLNFYQILSWLPRIFH